MPIPLLAWVAFAGGTALGIGGTVAATDAADEIGGAVSQSADALNRLSKTLLLAGTAYVVWENRAVIGRMLK